MAPRIVLTMIVKNETEVLERSLRSVHGLVDSWCIVDTGSTDGTQELIRTLMAGIPGELHERPWVDFARNRSEALELARPLGEYSLMLDADDHMELSHDSDVAALKASLFADAYYLDVLDHGTQYVRLGLTSTAIPWRYRGVLHEFPECDSETHTETLSGLNYVRVGGGARSQLSDKFVRDAQVLESALLTETDESLQCRYTYYLGQSYRDAEMPAEAIAAFERRAQMGGYRQEICVGLMSAGHLAHQLNYPFAQVLDFYLRAYDTIPNRAEPLYYAAKLCRDSDRLRNAYLFAIAAVEIPRPTDSLFQQLDVYTWRSEFELSVAAWYQPDWERGIAACQSLLANPAIPEAERALTVSNLALYTPTGR
jgi:glycosyltransferase involved in cell wall biosynthesis